MAVKTTVKGAITLVLGVAFLFLFVNSALPGVFGNNAFTLWLGGTNYSWYLTILVFMMLIGSLLKTLDFI